MIMMKLENSGVIKYEGHMPPKFLGGNDHVYGIRNTLNHRE